MTCEMSACVIICSLEYRLAIIWPNTRSDSIGVTTRTRSFPAALFACVVANPTKSGMLFR